MNVFQTDKYSYYHTMSHDLNSNLNHTLIRCKTVVLHKKTFFSCLCLPMTITVVCIVQSLHNDKHGISHSKQGILKIVSVNS